RGPVAFDDVDAVETDAEGLAAAQHHPAQLRCGRERLARSAVFGMQLDLPLHAEDAAADREHLQLGTLRCDVALGEDRLLAGWKIRELAGRRDDPDAVAIPAMDRLDDQRSGLEQRRQ